MLLRKKISVPVVLTAALLVGVIAIPLTFFFAFAKDEGTLGNGVFPNLIADLFNVFRFPTHSLLWDVFSSSTLLYFLGLILNALFYGLIVERILLVLSSWRKPKGHRSR
jgi:hypothetical protein